MKILGVNGIRTDGSESTDVLLADLACLGHVTAAVRYTWTPAIMARWRWWQKAAAKKLLGMHTPGDAVVAHSFGCLVTLRAMEMGALFGRVFLFAPAMDSNFIFPVQGANRIYVIHNGNDRAIKAGSMLVGHDFGTMGSNGYKGPPDYRVVNVPDPGDVTVDSLHHSHYFRYPNRQHWVEFIDERTRLPS